MSQPHKIESKMLSIIIPVYNERRTLGQVLVLVAEALARVPKEIIVVDDGSNDGTREWMQSNFPNGPRSGSTVAMAAQGSLIFGQESTSPSSVTIRPIYHDHNRGKGAALRTGLAKVSGDVLVIQDADLEYDPNDWEQMYDLIAECKVAGCGFRVAFLRTATSVALFSSLSWQSPDLISFQPRFQSDADRHRVLLQDDDQRGGSFTSLDSK